MCYPKVLTPTHSLTSLLTHSYSLTHSAIIIDLDMVKIIDLTGTQTLSEIVNEAKIKKISIVFININRPDVKDALIRSNIQNFNNKPDSITLSEYVQQSPLTTITEMPPKVEKIDQVEVVHEEGVVGIEMTDAKTTEFFVPYNNI